MWCSHGNGWGEDEMSHHLCWSKWGANRYSCELCRQTLQYLHISRWQYCIASLVSTQSLVFNCEHWTQVEQHCGHVLCSPIGLQIDISSKHNVTQFAHHCRIAWHVRKRDSLLVVVDLCFQPFLILYLLCLELLHHLKALLYVGVQILQQLQTQNTICSPCYVKWFNVETQCKARQGKASQPRRQSMCSCLSWAGLVSGKNWLVSHVPEPDGKDSIFIIIIIGWLNVDLRLLACCAVYENLVMQQWMLLSPHYKTWVRTFLKLWCSCPAAWSSNCIQKQLVAMAWNKIAQAETLEHDNRWLLRHDC